MAPAAATATRTASSSAGDQEDRAGLALDVDLGQVAAAEALGGLLAQAEQGGAHRGHPVLVHARRAGRRPSRRPSKDTTAAASSSGACASRSASARSSRAARPRGLVGHGAPRRIADVGPDDPHTSPSAAGAGPALSDRAGPADQRAPAAAQRARGRRLGERGAHRRRPEGSRPVISRTCATAWCSSRSSPDATGPAARRARPRRGRSATGRRRRRAARPGALGDAPAASASAAPRGARW